MILEVAILNVIEGKEKAFERDFIKAGKLISSISGYINHSLKKCIETKNQYILLVNWESVEAHEINFRTSNQYQEWKKLLHHYYFPFPKVEHYEKLI